MDANYVVMAVTLIVWIGIFLYLVSLDRKVKRLEKKNEN
jgi:CcmD family protein